MRSSTEHARLVEPIGMNIDFDCLNKSDSSLSLYLAFRLPLFRSPPYSSKDIDPLKSIPEKQTIKDQISVNLI